MVQWRVWGWGLGVFLGMGGAIAQIAPDGTLGTESTIVTPINQLRDQIEGCAIRGANLFHSLREFNIGAGREVYFANPTNNLNKPAPASDRTFGADLANNSAASGNMSFLPPRQDRNLTPETVGAGFTNQSPDQRTLGSDRNEIIEATGWIINEQGQVVLVASHTAPAYNPEITPINCHVR